MEQITYKKIKESEEIRAYIKREMTTLECWDIRSIL